MPPLRPPSQEDIRAIRAGTSEHNPGIGLVDTQTGQVYLRLASTFPEDAHLGLVEEVLGITDIADTGHLRGFVVFPKGHAWVILNVSGLNPHDTKMEKGIFQSVTMLLESFLGSDAE